MHITTIIKRFSLAGLPMLATAVLGAAPAVPVAAVQNSCQEVTRLVAAGPGLPADQTVKGTLCMPDSFAGPATVDVLVAGATYNRSYWDFGFGGQQYSYVSRTLKSKRATFAYDRPGTGQSTHPLSSTLTVESDAFVLHSLIDWLRTSQGFSQVNTVGHSYASIMIINEAATYQDVDRVVATGLLHTTTPGQSASFGDFYPSFLDPQFASLGLDPGYLTTVPGTRQVLFYSAIADPAVIAYDEAHKDVVSGSQFGEAIGQSQTPAPANLTQGVTVPVLEIVGEEDYLACVDGSVDCNDQTALEQNEAPYFTNAPSLSVVHIDDTGHSLTLHPTASQSFAKIDLWIKTH